MLLLTETLFREKVYFLKKSIQKMIVFGFLSYEIFVGKGMSGRFTVPGMKAPKRKTKSASGLGKKWDEDEVEYEPQKTKREEDKEKAEIELEERRQEIKSEQVRKELEKASRPKKAAPPRKTEWEVEMVTKMKVMSKSLTFLVLPFNFFLSI